MIKQDYIVLTRPDPATLGEPHKLAPSDAGALHIETGILSSQAEEIARDPGTRAIAPVIAVRLAQPLKSGDTPAPPDPPGTTWGIAAVGADRSEYTGKGVKVAVLDTGIAAEHPAFADRQVVASDDPALPGRRLVQKDFTGEGDGDLNGHGTHCAGTLFGDEVGGRRIGVAPGVSCALIGKVLNRHGAGTTKQIVDGIRWAVDEGANVISVSIGFDFPRIARQLIEQGVPLEAATSMALEGYRDNVRLFDALSDLLHAGRAIGTKAIVVAAAGNESRRPDYQIATAPPAAAKDLISVGALGRSADSSHIFTVAPFSNARPRVSAPGVDVTSASHTGGLTTMSGTSMAAPHAAGVAALWWQQMSELNPAADIRVLSARLIGGTSTSSLLSSDALANAGSGLVRAP